MNSFWQRKNCIKFLSKTLKNSSAPGQSHGFTMVELIVALIMGIILLSSISIIVGSAYDFYFDGRKKIQLQQDLSLIEQLLSRKIKASLKGDQEIFTNYAAYQASQSAQTSGSCLKLLFSGPDSVIIYKDDSDFKVIDENGITQNLIQGTVDQLNFVDQTSFIQTEYSFVQGGWVLTDTLNHAFRNSD
ncbi:MAG: hypothetical protein DWQ05_18850 [Calditrichaeota bacterium]|nr:MAG: hypothetical protein DWQ05_18850 [Calditrichota bacterium]